MFLFLSVYCFNFRASGISTIPVTHTPDKKHSPRLVCHLTDKYVRHCHTKLRRLLFYTVYYVAGIASIPKDSEIKYYVLLA